MYVSLFLEKLMTKAYFLLRPAKDKQKIYYKSLPSVNVTDDSEVYAEASTHHLRHRARCPRRGL